MRKRYRILLALLVVAVAGVIAWQGLHEREPVYQGKGLKAWLTLFYNVSANGVERSTAADAIWHIGTNGIPTLLSMLRQDEPALLSFAERRLDGRTPKWMYRLLARGAANRNSEAASGFVILGTNAGPAVPALVELFEQNVSDQSQLATSLELAYIGPAAKQAIPALLRGTTNSSWRVRINALSALLTIETEPSVIVPTLTKLLGDSSWLVRLTAIESLGRFGADARQAVPALVRLLNGENEKVSSAATNALLRIDPEAAAKAGAAGRSRWE